MNNLTTLIRPDFVSVFRDNFFNEMPAELKKNCTLLEGPVLPDTSPPALASYPMDAEIEGGDMLQREVFLEYVCEKNPQGAYSELIQTAHEVSTHSRPFPELQIQFRGEYYPAGFRQAGNADMMIFVFTIGEFF